MTRFYLRSILILIFCTSCAISSGISKPNSSIYGGNHIYVEELDTFFEIGNLDSLKKEIKFNNKNIIIGVGDSLALTFWGIDELKNNARFFSDPNISRVVDADGNIFLPYAGDVYLNGLTLNEARVVIKKELSKKFVDPQISIEISQFNKSRKVYILGELEKPKEIQLGIENISLSEAIQMAGNTNKMFRAPDHIYLIRNIPTKNIYKIKLASLDYPIYEEIYLITGDIIYVPERDFTKFTRLFRQFFPI